jgi:hypothetical protein
MPACLIKLKEVRAKEKSFAFLMKYGLAVTWHSEVLTEQWNTRVNCNTTVKLFILYVGSNARIFTIFGLHRRQKYGRPNVSGLMVRSRVGPCGICGGQNGTG